MPIYEYACEECGHRLEAMQKMSDAPLTDCPSCGAARLKRLISPVSFRLKGGGWYETDFKSGNKRYVADGDGQGAEKSGGEGAQAAGDSGKGATSGESSRSTSESSKSSESATSSTAKPAPDKAKPSS